MALDDKIQTNVADDLHETLIIIERLAIALEGIIMRYNTLDEIVAKLAHRIDEIKSHQEDLNNFVLLLAEIKADKP